MTVMIASQILSWIVIVALALVCLALARQIGVLHERVAPAGALSVNQRIKAGVQSPDLNVQSLGGAMVALGGTREARSQLLFFLSPDCPVCKALLPALKSAAANEAGWLDVVLVGDGANDAHQAYIAQHELTQFPYVVSELVGRSFGVGKLPYAVLIGADGVIDALGLVNSREHLESLFEAKERGVTSIQDYIARRA